MIELTPVWVSGDFDLGKWLWVKTVD